MARSNVTVESDPLQWWNPRKLILQIVLLQLAYTLTATILVTFLVLVMGAPFRLDYIFLDTSFRQDIVFGWSLAFLSILASLFTYLPFPPPCHNILEKNVTDLWGIGCCIWC